MATHIGSVFLGDFQRHRILSSSSATPPSSPPPSSPPSSISAFFPHPMPANHHDHDPTPALKPPPHPTIDPELALDLRLRWLEAILLGVKQDYPSARDRKGKEREKPYELSHGETLCRITEDLQRRLDAVVEGNDGLKRFMSQYDQHAHLLTPAFALSGTLPDSPSYENMSPEQLEAFLTEMEPDIRAADRDMREIELLEQKGVTGAGKLADYEYLQPRLDALLKEHRQNLELAASLEKRVAGLIERHATQVDALSELFVEWDDTITLAENKVTKLEREREERRRLGLEY